MPPVAGGCHTGHMPTTRIAGIAASAMTVTLLSAPAQADAPACVEVPWAERAIAEVAVPMPDGWRLDLACGGDELVLGHAHDGVVTVYADRFSGTDELQWTYLHEVGHAYDHAYLTGADRDRWRQLRGIPADYDWWLGDLSGPDRAWSDIPAEDFAEAFAWHHSGQPWPGRTIGDPPIHSHLLSTG